MANSHGRFLWYELVTTDMAAAGTFYSNVVGWDTQDASAPGRPYTLFTIDKSFVGGLMTLPDGERALGMGSRWIGYVGVDDVDAAVQRIKQLGGAIQVPPTDIPNLSRFAIVSDPQTATIALIKWAQPSQEAALRARGRVGWHELLAADDESAWIFYRELFGWQKAAAAVGANDTYQPFSAGGQTIGAMFTKPPTVPAPFWLYYFNVGDIDAAAKRVQSSGGEILNGPIEVPDGSWIVQCADPQDGIFALIGRRSAAGFLERVAAQT